MIAQLVTDIGSADVVTSLVRTYLGELAVRCTGLREDAARGDVASARRAAHTLRSASGVLGAVDLAEACQVVESMQGAEEPIDGEALRSAVNRIMTVSAQTEDELRAWMGEGSHR